jgi:hypothetical protein
MAYAANVFSPAQPGDPTYAITAVDIAPSLTDETATVVEFATAWPDSGFPGYVTCRAEVFDSTPGLLARRDFQYASFVANDVSRVDLATDGVVAEEATMVCSKGDVPGSSAGYVLSNARVESHALGPPRLIFHTEWTSDEPPLYQECKVEFRLTDGSQQTYDFGLSAGRGQEATVLLTAEFEDSKPTTLKCEAFGSREGPG